MIQSLFGNVLNKYSAVKRKRIEMKAAYVKYCVDVAKRSVL